MLALESVPASEEETADLINRRSGVNRIVGVARASGPVGDFRVLPAHLTAQRLDRLRHADAIVRRLSQKFGYDDAIWQFPVVLIPFGVAARPDSVVLRPVDSVDGMTARAVRIPPDLLGKMVRELMEVEGVAGVFYDLTNKPPATIEWE